MATNPAEVLTLDRRIVLAILKDLSGRAGIPDWLHLPDGGDEEEHEAMVGELCNIVASHLPSNTEARKDVERVTRYRLAVSGKNDGAYVGMTTVKPDGSTELRTDPNASDWVRYNDVIELLKGGA